ncbi:MAG TPA: hypothetical protein VG826_23300 [Pirellulales bacterium]|nr:hypothetical protein [Pirellulales bacterium]
MSQVLLIAALFATADPLSSQADQPYVIKVCLRFSDDPAFTAVFADSVRWQVRDQLRNFFGPLAEVELIEGHPWLEKHGGEDLLDWNVSPDELQDAGIDGKLFVFELGFEEGKYRVAWRQIDGDVQQVGPPGVRTTVDRPWLAKSICLAVKEDFAPVALVKPGIDPATVRMEFRGSQTKGAERLATWLADDCVLQPFWVVRQREKTTRVAIPNTVLCMSHADGPAKARVVSNRSQPWQQSARVVGFQAIRVRTVTGRIRLRLVDAETGAPVRGCLVLAGDKGFDALGDANRLPASDSEGYVASPKALRNVAYVRVEQATKPIRFPIPLLADWNEQVCKVPVDRQAREKNDLVRELTYLMQDVRALRAALREYVSRVNELNGQKRYEEALRECDAALAFVKKFRPPIQKGMADCEKRGELLAGGAGGLLKRLAEQDREIAEHERGLETLNDNLRQTIARNDAQNRANVLIDLGRQSELDGDGDEAIVKYEQALAEQPDQPQLKDKVGRLKEVWRIKNPRHQAARDFVLKEWSECEVTDLKRRLPEAEQALETLEGVGDYLSLGRFSHATLDHVDELADLIEQLAERATEADGAEQDEQKALLERIEEFHGKIAAAQKASIGKFGGDSAGGKDSAPPAASPLEEEE